MCGFAGSLKLEAQGSALPDSKRIDLVFKSIEQRGPDAEGQWYDSHVWFGHRRLSIVDLDNRGAQPMEYGNFVIVFNGMIYNYREIKKQLLNKGFHFQTDTDTEVIAAGWASWGEELLDRLQGMFAFAIWDKKEKTLYLVRDRLGKKPLFFRNWNGKLVFGSRFDTVEALSEPAALSSDALSWLMTLKYIPDPFSANNNIHKVSAGQFIKIKNDSFEKKNWYEPLPDKTLLSLSYDMQKQMLRDIIEQSVAKRLISDVPLGCFLSGGIDSAIIAAIANRIKPIDTFTVGFDDSYFDESEAAARTASHLGLKNHRIRLHANEQLDILDQLFESALDEPFGDSSALPSLFICKAMKNYATVALSGDGADEIFGGYRKYQGEIMAGLWQRVPWFIQKMIGFTLRRLPRGRTSLVFDKLRQLDKFISGAELSYSHRHAHWMSIAPNEKDLQDLIGSCKQAEIVSLLEKIAFPKNIDNLSKTLLTDIKTVLISDMLVKIDRTSMNSGLEVRSPFLDHHVLEASLAVKGQFKIAWGEGKKILREAFINELPSENFSSPKRGFEIPLNKWLAGPLIDKITKALSPDFLAYNNLNPKLGNVIQNGISRGLYPHAEMGWTLMSVWSWQEARGFK